MRWVIGFLLALALPVAIGLASLYNGCDLSNVIASVTVVQLTLLAVLAFAWSRLA